MSIGRFLRSLLQYLHPYRPAAVLILFGLMLEMSVNALVPLSFKFLVDDVIPGRNRQSLALVITALVAGVVLMAAGGLLRDWLYSRLSNRILADIRARLFEHLQRLSPDFYARNDAGQIVARFSTDLSAVEQAVASATWGLMPCFDLVLTTALLFILNWRLALVAMLIWPLSLAGPRFLAPPATRAAYLKKEEEADALSDVQENAVIQPVIKAFGLEGLATGKYAARNAALLNRAVRASFLGALIERSAGLGILVLQVAIMAVGAMLALDGKLGIGTLAAFQALFITLSYAIYNAAQFSPTLVQAAGGMRRIEEILEENPSVADSPGAVAAPLLKKGIELASVTFAYPGREPVLRAVDLRVERGWFVGVVGASGSGKSTVLNLMLRFCDPSAGSVRIDDRDYREVSQASLRKQMGVVFQENLLFNASFAENIRAGKPDATDAEVQDAARAAEIHDFIRSLPDGYAENVGERGSRLSGGQRQRVAIARALLRSPSLLVLDEATSALDPQTETSINATLSRAAQGRSVVSVTHRLSSVTHADCIYVLDQGRVVESGRHKELLARGGYYRQLWEKQNGFIASVAGASPVARPGALRRLRLLDHLDDSLLEAMAARFHAESFQRGTEIVRQGDVGDKLYVIVRGQVEVTSLDPDGAPHRLAVLGDGDFFGEMALLDSSPRTASVTALAFCTCLTLARTHFDELLARFPEVRASMEEEVVRRRAGQAQGA